MIDELRELLLVAKYELIEEREGGVEELLLYGAGRWASERSEPNLILSASLSLVRVPISSSSELTQPSGC